MNRQLPSRDYEQRPIQQSFVMHCSRYELIAYVKGVAALYECTSRNGRRNWEVWKITTRNGRDVYPATRHWGYKGWTLTRKDDAIKKFSSMTNSRA